MPALSAVEGLPGGITPPRALQAAYEALSPETRALLTERLASDLSAEWLADTLTTAGFKISASSIRTYRRRTRRKDGAS